MGQSSSQHTSAAAAADRGQALAVAGPGRSSRSSPSPAVEPPPPGQIDGGRFYPLTNIYPNTPKVCPVPSLALSRPHRAVAQEYDRATVHSLIDSRRMAPFYRGIEEDIDRDNRANIDALDAALDAVGDRSRTNDPPEERNRERRMYLEGDESGECPICFL
jgi:hypothetical protein